MGRLEKSVEQSFVRWCKRQGFLCLKLRPFIGRGFPDRTVLLGGGLCVFVEFKTAEGRLSPHQVQWLRTLNHLGYACGTAITLEEAIAIVDQGFTNAPDF